MNKVTTYFREAYDELVNKVTWPTWVELQESSVIVLVTSLLLSIVIFLVDLIFKYGAQELYKLIVG